MYKAEQIKTKDGRSIRLRIYSPERETNRVIVIAPSAEVTQKFYYDFACYFLLYDFSVVTFDYRGVGDSAPEVMKGYDAKLDQWAFQDTDAVLRFVKNRNPKQEIIFIGHGVGGEIIGLAPASQYINKIVLVNCALSCSRLRRWKDKIWIGAMKTFVKITSWLFGYFPGKKLGVMNNIPRGVMYEWIHWCNNENGLFDDFSDHNYRKLQVPLLALSFTDDWRSQKSGVIAMLEHFTSACITWRHLKPSEAGVQKMGHSGFFKLNRGEKTWHDLLRWMNDDGYGKINSVNREMKYKTEKQ
jgi:predicted alpha/beta hydrolase